MPEKPYQNRLLGFYAEYPQMRQLDYLSDGARDAHAAKVQVINNRVWKLTKLNEPATLQKIGMSCSGHGVNMSDLVRSANAESKANEENNVQPILDVLQEEFEQRLREIENR